MIKTKKKKEDAIQSDKMKGIYTQLVIIIYSNMQ